LFGYRSSPPEREQNEDIDEVWTLLENLTRHERDLLIEAIAATLTHHGNP
jgi:hypothetical protein